MARIERGFEGAKLAGVIVDADGVQVAADTDTGVVAGDLQATIVALAARIEALENPA